MAGFYRLELIEPLSGQLRTLCLYDCITPEEIKLIIAAAFDGIEASSIVGLQDNEKGTNFPFSMLSKCPSYFDGKSVSIISSETASLLQHRMVTANSMMTDYSTNPEVNEEFSLDIESDTEDKVHKTFRILDKNGDGLIHKEEFIEVLSDAFKYFLVDNSRFQFAYSCLSPKELAIAAAIACYHHRDQTAAAVADSNKPFDNEADGDPYFLTLLEFRNWYDVNADNDPLRDLTRLAIDSVASLSPLPHPSNSEHRTLKHSKSLLELRLQDAYADERVKAFIKSCQYFLKLDGDSVTYLIDLINVSTKGSSYIDREAFTQLVHVFLIQHGGAITMEDHSSSSNNGNNNSSSRGLNNLIDAIFDMLLPPTDTVNFEDADNCISVLQLTSMISLLSPSNHLQNLKAVFDTYSSSIDEEQDAAERRDYGSGGGSSGGSDADFVSDRIIYTQLCQVLRIVYYFSPGISSLTGCYPEDIAFAASLKLLSFVELNRKRAHEVDYEEFVEVFIHSLKLALHVLQIGRGSYFSCFLQALMGSTGAAAINGQRSLGVEHYVAALSLAANFNDSDNNDSDSDDRGGKYCTYSSTSATAEKKPLGLFAYDSMRSMTVQHSPDEAATLDDLLGSVLDDTIDEEDEEEMEDDDDDEVEDTDDVNGELDGGKEYYDDTDDLVDKEGEEGEVDCLHSLQYSEEGGRMSPDDVPGALEESQIKADFIDYEGAALSVQEARAVLGLTQYDPRKFIYWLESVSSPSGMIGKESFESGLVTAIGNIYITSNAIERSKLDFILDALYATFDTSQIDDNTTSDDANGVTTGKCAILDLSCALLLFCGQNFLDRAKLALEVAIKHGGGSYRSALRAIAAVVKAAVCLDPALRPIDFMIAAECRAEEETAVYFPYKDGSPKLTAVDATFIELFANALEMGQRGEFDLGLGVISEKASRAGDRWVSSTTASVAATKAATRAATKAVAKALESDISITDADSVVGLSTNRVATTADDEEAEEEEIKSRDAFTDDSSDDEGESVYLNDELFPPSAIVLELRAARAVMGLETYSADSLMESIAEFCHAGTLSEEGWMKWLSLVTQQSEVSEYDIDIAVFLGSRLFAAFDATNSGEVEYSAITTGVAFLCGGSTLSDRLTVAFTVVDSDCDGSITLQEFEDLIYAALVAIAVCSRMVADKVLLTGATLRTLAEAAAREALGSLNISDISSSSGSDAITLDMLVDMADDFLKLAAIF